MDTENVKSLVKSTRYNDRLFKISNIQWVQIQSQCYLKYQAIKCIQTQFIVQCKQNQIWMSYWTTYFAYISRNVKIIIIKKRNSAQFSHFYWDKTHMLMLKLPFNFQGFSFIQITVFFQPNTFNRCYVNGIWNFYCIRMRIIYNEMK